MENQIYGEIPPKPIDASKQVKIIGLSLNDKLGILKACQMQFNPDNRLTIIKGAVGQGKSTLKTALDLGTRGQKTLVDKSIYGDIDCETQLLDGDIKIYVGCKTDKSGSLVYTLYTRDDNGKIVRDPIIDGVKATPAKYLELLQTELTWRMEELTSDNPVIQRKILIDLYKFELEKSGVILDKKHPDYNNSILGQIESAEKDRDFKDMLRKQKGGIAEDLKSKGFDVDRPATIPDYIDIMSIEAEISQLQNEKAIGEANILNQKNNALERLKSEAEKITDKCKAYNDRLKVEYKLAISKHENEIEKQKIKQEKITKSKKLLEELIQLGYSGSQVNEWIDSLPKPDEVTTVIEPEYIRFDEDGRVIISDSKNAEIGQLFIELNDIRSKYSVEFQREYLFDSSMIEEKITWLQERKKQAIEINKIVEAVDSFHSWRESNNTVIELKHKYYKMLADINTGVDGLRIAYDEKSNDIFLMYNGTFDPAYFNNTNLEYRKISSYSGTQKPLICLLVQNYLLSKKPKALRYMYIDNVPMDNRTQGVLRDICDKLNVNIFLNITGDFSVDSLKDGEILIEGGEVFFG